MAIKLLLANTLAKLSPPTRWFELRACLYRWAGVDVAANTRIVSSANILGIMRLRIGSGTFIGHQVMIVGGNSNITIGNNVDIGPRVVIAAGTHVIDMEGLNSAGQGLSLDINIEDGVWIGANSTIIGGISIGKKSIIGAGSVVVKDIPSHTIAVGNPCQPVKKWNEVEKEWEDLRASKALQIG